MSFKPTKVEEMLAQGLTHELYKDPQAQIDSSILVYEKYTACNKCGQKKMKVSDWQNHEAYCQNCGYSAKDKK